MPQRLLRHLPLLVLLAACLGLGVTHTAGLTWPHDADLYRNMAQAQTMADGDWFADPNYRGEKAWYNPLTPALIAVLHRITGIAIPRLYAQAGAVLNLAVPAAFYVLAHAFFGRLTALLATVYVVFLGHPGEASWMRPAYAPWFFAGTFGQAFFCLCLVAYARALEGKGRRAFVITGGLLGLAFLSHTAPAVLLGGVVVCELLRRGAGELRHPSTGEAQQTDTSAPPQPGAAIPLRLRHHALLFAVALAVSMPFLATILGVYHLRVVNPAGNDWYWWPFELGRFLPYAAGHLSLSTLLSIGGLLQIARGRARVESGLVLLFLTLAMSLVLYGLLSQWAAARGLHLLNLVAPHHFWLYVKMAGAIGWGYAAASLLRVARPYLRLSAWSSGRATAALTVFALVVSVLELPTLAAREDFARARREARRASAQEWRDAIWTFLREHASPTDVVLADPDDALMVVGPAGRKTVAVLANFASPYVAAVPREEAARAMLAALDAEDGAAFLTLAARYRVGWVLHRKSGRFGLDRRALPFLARELREGPFVLYRVAPSP